MLTRLLAAANVAEPGTVRGSGSVQLRDKCAADVENVTILPDGVALPQPSPIWMTKRWRKIPSLRGSTWLHRPERVLKFALAI